MVLFGGISAGAVILSGISSYFGMQYGMNGLRARIERIERYTESIPSLDKRIAVLETRLDERDHR